MAKKARVKDFENPPYFFRMYRRMWLALAILSYLLIPFATLGFVGLIPWLSTQAALLIYLCSFNLHLTLFVAGYWNPKVEAKKTEEPASTQPEDLKE